ncbi:MAG: PEP-CTERM sorting domain-containing protein [Syntrophobacteraceae bacterium]|jgi:hypothetical protein
MKRLVSILIMIIALVGFMTVNAHATPSVPEPATCLLLGAGIAVLGLARSRRKKD